MFGFRYVKFQPSEFILRYRKGKLTQEGVGLAFRYRTRTTVIVSIPVGTTDSAFIFEEVTQDFQNVTVQGQATWRIVDHKKIAGLLNYTLDLNHGRYASDDPQKLAQRVVNVIHVLTRKHIGAAALKDAVVMSGTLADEILSEARDNEEIRQMGLEVMGLSILAVLPNKETARALEAQAREQILKKADEAIYERRNAAIEQERRIKENELNTEIAMEQKKRQIRDAQLEAQRSAQAKGNEIKNEQMNFDTEMEEKRRQLVELSVQNEKAAADAKAYAVAGVMKALEGVSPTVIQALSIANITPGKLAALALQGLAENAGKIGTLNIAPDLVTELLKG